MSATAKRKVAAKPSANGRSAALAKKFASKRGIILDVGCGRNPQPGAVGMDHQAFAEVDIVHSWDEFPWPLDDESVLTIIASHVVEHVNPVNGHFISWMNECWRVLKPEGQIAIATPYAGTRFYWMDPTHCNPCNQDTWRYFSPEDESRFYGFYEPGPFKIEQNLWHSTGMMEVVLRKQLDQPHWHHNGEIKYGRKS
jgi:SAM-dependent methyltransferase